MKTKHYHDDPRRGAILGVVLVVVGLVSFIGMGLMELAARDGEEASKAVSNTRAFWLAEAGVQRIVKRLYDGTPGNVGNRTLGYGKYRVWLHDTADPPYAVARGRAGSSDRYIRVDLVYLASPYEDTVYGGGAGGGDWVLDLRGSGDPNSWNDRGGRDIINGDIYANGDLYMDEDSEVNPAPAPNTYNLNGDVEVTGGITVDGSASISGGQTTGVDPRESPDLNAMDYANNNTYDIAQIFDDLGISSGYLPAGHPLRDVVMKNPSGRTSECASTTGDDFFFEPRVCNNNGADSHEARTPLDLGDGNLYYVDGEVWFHSDYVYGFEVDGQATIVATHDVHISDNLKYKDSTDLLGLIALGEYDAGGDLDSGGNFYFGDPEFGTLFTVDAFMFAGNDFLYNTRSTGPGQEEPESGFEVYGNFAAINRVSVNRDWYRPSGGGSRRAAWYDHSTDEWKDVVTDDPLTPGEISGMRHYRMKVSYDERIRDPTTQPPGLPEGGGSIFGGMVGWAEVNTSSG